MLPRGGQAVVTEPGGDPVLEVHRYDVPLPAGEVSGEQTIVVRTHNVRVNKKFLEWWPLLTEISCRAACDRAGTAGLPGAPP